MNEPLYTDNLNTKLPKTTKGCLIIIVTLLILVAIVGIIVTLTECSDPTSRVKKKALIAASEDVRKELICPATAEFPTLGDEGVRVRQTSNNTFEVSAYVDSQNRFGAMVRTYFDCEVILSEDNYRVKNLIFSE